MASEIFLIYEYVNLDALGSPHLQPGISRQGLALASGTPPTILLLFQTGGLTWSRADDATSLLIYFIFIRYKYSFIYILSVL